MSPVPLRIIVSRCPTLEQSGRLDSLQAAEQFRPCRHELVIGELEAFIEEHPYRERAWYLLIESLARSGRRIEAAAACDRLREQLNEAGVVPGAELESLDRRVRAGGSG